MNKGLQLYTKKLPNAPRQRWLLLQILAALILYTGCLWMLTSMFGLDYYGWIIVPVGMALVVAMGFFWNKQSWIYHTVFVVTCCFVAGFLMNMQFMKNGLFATLNRAIETIGHKTGAYYSLYEINSSGQMERICESIFIFFFAAVLAVICALVAYGRQQVFLLFLVSILCGLMMGFHVEPNLWSSFLFFTGVFFCWALRQLPYGRWKLAGSLVGGVVMVLLFSTAVCAIGKAATRKDNVFASVISQLRYGIQTSQDYPQGALQGIGAKPTSDTTALEVTAEIPEPMYLRGFVGTDFDGSTFVAEDATTLYEKYDTFYWMHKSGIYANAMYQRVSQLLDPDTEDSFSELRIRVKHADRKYLYTPYELANPGELTHVQNTNDVNSVSTKAFGARSYALLRTTKFFDTPLDLKTKLVATKKEHPETLEQYLYIESHYQEYAYANYTALDEDTKLMVAQALGVEAGTIYNYEQAYQAIMTYLCTNLTYNPSIAFDGNQSFVSELFYEKEGYDIHYAALATILYRYLGIPARYVEGYIIDETAASKMKAGEPYAISMNQAHAWVEIYRDGMGWYPVEFIPEYILSMGYDFAQLTGLADNKEYIHSLGEAGKKLSGL